MRLAVLALLAVAAASADDSVAALNRKVQDGSLKLSFDGVNGYLRSVLHALHVPAESQLAVFSRTSVQAFRISATNPRALYFNDHVAVGWVRGGDFLELAAQDPESGVVFYKLDQVPAEKPRFNRDNTCLNCHMSAATDGIAGMLVRSVHANGLGAIDAHLGSGATDHRTPIAGRWGGWYVTGKPGIPANMGFPVDRLGQEIDLEGYLTPYSDVAALLVFDHQMHMVNLITHLGWETRNAIREERLTPTRLDGMARNFTDYLFFVDEAPLPAPVAGTSGFAEFFGAQGPRDSKGRSLRQFDLKQRLLRYPCSYMIYSEAFDAMPVEARDAVYKRMWEILSGREKAEKYARFSPDDRRAVIEILRETKKGLPDYWRP